MPSVGGIQKLLVLVLAATILGATASSASAAPVWVWACQGPNGQFIDTTLADVRTTVEARVDTSSAGCGPGVSLGFTRTDPVANSSATVRISLPSGVNASKVRIVRNSAGFGAAPNAYRFTASLDRAGTLEQVDGGSPLTGETPIISTNGSGSLNLSLSCTSTTERCPSGAPTVEIERIGVLVDDTVAPRGAVGWNSPVHETAPVTPSVSDEGVGLERAEIVISAVQGGPALLTATGSFGDCAELSPGDATNDRALDSSACPTAYTSRKLEPSTALLPDGKYWRTVTVFDAAGNPAKLLDHEFEVFHPNLGSSVQTLSIGSSGVDAPQPNPNPGPGGGGGVQGDQSSSCRTPRLSVTLRSKPLRISKGRPVLLAKKRYRFEGRLTCVVNGKRRSAPKGTRISVLNKVGRKTVSKPATRLRASGKLKAVLKTPNVRGSRTLIFRYRNASGQRSQVSIRVTITKRAPKR